MVISSLLLVLNKLAIHFLHAPAFLLFAQLLSSWVSVKVAAMIGIIQCDGLSVAKVKGFWLVSMCFLISIFTNIKTLQYCNVETFIVFRCGAPLIICVADWYFLGRQLPNGRSVASLIAILCGATAYVMTDKDFNLNGYKWLVGWLTIFTFDQIYIKHAVDSTKFDTNWGRVYYANLMGSIPLIFIGGGTGEAAKIVWSANGTIVLVISCVFGCAMSYFAFLARSLVSSTSFTVLGTVCKLSTVVINVMIWNKHASPFGLSCLCSTLVAAYFYKQAPLREDYVKELEAKNAGGN